jgi:hypothetical protein
MKQLINTTKLRKALKRFWNIHFVRRSFSFPKGTKHEFDCECGKKIIVWTNNYGQGNTGKGSCKCGAEVYIN